jgi:hypothetical protein
MPVKVKSDADPRVSYDVSLDVNGHAYRCTCPQWARAHDCKHLERAELAPRFRAAAAYLVKIGYCKDWADLCTRFNWIVESLRAQHGARAVNEAIKAVIKRARHEAIRQCPSLQRAHVQP